MLCVLRCIFATMSTILLLETASEVCSVAIAADGQVIACVEEAPVASHAAQLTLQIQACAREAGLTLPELDAVAVSRGPGAYTSLRVGASVAKGICYALDKPLIAVDTLEALAGACAAWHQQQPGNHKTALYVPALDARRQEIWMAVYDADLQLRLPAQPLILENNSFYDVLQPWQADDGLTEIVVGGNGTEKIRNGGFEQNTVFFTEIRCSARHLAAIAAKKMQQTDYEDVAYFEPFYMKLPNITTPNNTGIQG
jgi:tRNA threonylcarbamoyladenosine biosynthesis protein TsaB